MIYKCLYLRRIVYIKMHVDQQLHTEKHHKKRNISSVVWYIFHILGISSSQWTFIFFRGVDLTTNQTCFDAC